MGIVNYLMRCTGFSENDCEELVQEQVDLIRNGETDPFEACDQLGIEQDFAMDLINRAAG